MRYVAAAALALIMAMSMPSAVYAQLITVNPPTNGACWGGLWNVTVLPGQYLLIHVLSNNYSLYIFTPPGQYSRWVSGEQAYAVYAQNMTGGAAYVIPMPQGQYQWFSTNTMRCGGD